LKTAAFIAQRLVSTSAVKSSVSAPIIKIAITAICIGVVLMTWSVSIGIGFKQKIRQKVSSFQGHIQIMPIEDNASDVSKTPIFLDSLSRMQLLNIDGVMHIQGVASKAGVIRTEEAVEGVLFKGVGKDFKENEIEAFLIEGKMPNLKSELNEEVIIPVPLANRMQLKLGDRIPTYFLKDDGSGKYNLRVFKIVGIFKSGFQEFDNQWLIGDIRHLQRINKWNPEQVGNYEIYIQNFDQLERISEEIYAQTPYDLMSQTILDVHQFIFEWLSLLDFNVVLLLFIMILVASVNMVVVMLVLILERTQLIGLLKALGANNKLIRNVFLLQALPIIAKGLFLGNVIALSTLALQYYTGFIALDPENYHLAQVPVVFNIWHFIGINVLTLAITLSSLLLPALLIAKVKPVQALKFS
jgi:lipoprotein-releasing system permease protein